MKEMEKLKEPWSVNTFAIEALSSYLKDKDYLIKIKEWIKVEREKFYKELIEIKEIEVYRSYTNFFLIKLKKSNSKRLKEFLFENNFFIRTCEDFKFLNEEYIRINIKMREENHELKEKIKEFFNILKNEE